MRAGSLMFSPIALALALAGMVLFAVGSAGADGEGGSHLPSPRGHGLVHAASGAITERANGAVEPIVVGNDERVRVTDTSVYPFSAVVWLELYDEFGTEIGNCTGTFIGPDALLTAGHCLYDPEFGWTADIAVVPGRDASVEPFGWEWAESWWVPDLWFETGGDLFDWGIIRMETRELAEAVGWFYLAELTTDSLLALDFEPAIVGYPGDASPEATMWFDWMPYFVDVDEFLLYHEIDTSPGMSGSAVFSSNSESDLFGAVVGIHVRGDAANQINEAMRIDAFIIADLDEGCVQLGCTFEYFLEEEPLATATPTKSPTPTVTPTKTPTATLMFRLALPFVGRD